jgi:hypothetical protein
VRAPSRSSANIATCSRNFAHFFAHGSCGFCKPCRVGTNLLRDALDKIAEGRGPRCEINELMRLAELLRRTSHCGLGQKAGNPVRDTWLKFRPAYERRLIRGGRTGWTSSRRADGCRPTVRCERPYERAARQLIRRKAPRNQKVYHLLC